MQSIAAVLSSLNFNAHSCKHEEHEESKMSSLTDYPELLEWQRKLDPENFNKKTGAQYHTAPSVVFPDSADYPSDAPDDSVTILFRIDEESWIGEPEKITIYDPLIIEKTPRRKSKNGPIIIMDDKRAYAAIPVKENYYWSANVLSKHRCVRIEFRPGKIRHDGKTRKIVVVATFIPNEDD